MKKKIIVQCILIIFMINISKLSSHSQELHQFITREAFKLLQKSFPGKLNEMLRLIGSNETIYQIIFLNLGVL